MMVCIYKYTPIGVYDDKIKISSKIDESKNKIINNSLAKIKKQSENFNINKIVRKIEKLK